MDIGSVTGVAPGSGLRQLAGVASYWVVVPDELWLRAWELEGEGYVEVADVTGDEAWTAISPFDVTVVPGRLAD